MIATINRGRSVFVRILDKYFNGERDVRTLQVLEKLKGQTSKETA